ncbi:MAG: hypothetical protein WD382_03480 [Halofilum sp. (in: g-proteobacteria)]
MRNAVALGTGVLVMVVAAAALAQEIPGQEEFQTDQATFQEWDADGDGQLSRDEFMRGARSAGLFGMWDSHNDGRIDRNEFDEVGFGGDFAHWDTNTSAYLDPTEVYRGVFATQDGDDNDRWSMEDWLAFGEQSWFNG